MLATTIEYKGGQLLTSMLAGLITALEAGTMSMVPCFIILILDVISAHQLGLRVKHKYPNHADGKFKSRYGIRILITIIVLFLAISLGSYVDQMILRDVGQDHGVRFVMGTFIFYQSWSILENWSSENDNKIAIALQRVMVNKVERHLNVPLSDILINNKNEKEDGTSN